MRLISCALPSFEQATNMLSPKSAERIARQWDREIVPELGAALDLGLELTPEGDELTVLPTYTAMLELRRIVAERGYARQYWERAA
jgi:hypothetical protein